MVSKPRFWQKAPAVRLLLPLCAGIMAQWYVQFPALVIILFGIFLSLLLLFYEALSTLKKFRFTALYGLLLHLLFISGGAALVQTADIRHQPKWIGHYNAQSVLLKLEEPLVQKPNSYKALASVQQVFENGITSKATGNVILYFKKDSSALKLAYGALIIIAKPLQPIKNSGNPGGFDFKRYSLFNSVTHQLYVTPSDFFLLPNKEENKLKSLLFQSRATIISILRKNIKGDKEQGLAEALLIGYKDDLDKALVQSYSNTGVVHVIAISGLHLGIIYWILLLLTKPLRPKKTAWLRLALILCGLWAFSLLAGAQPSILRSAVMFSAIAWSTVINRRTSIYNTLALSALVLLIYNPFWLWDVGFQLSYSAVLSIIIFFRPVYSWLYFPNKLVDFVWGLAAASLAAQILTLPVSVYHFHQFPTLFLVANLFAVPLSSVILIGEILLCAVSFISPLSTLLGRFLGWLIQIMNNLVENLDRISFAVWKGLSVTVLQAALLYLIIAGISYWLLQKRATGFRLAAVGCIFFLALRTQSIIEANNQKKIIVYNVPKWAAADVISGRKYYFLGDASLEQNDFLRNFYIQPSRTAHRISSYILPIKGPSFSVAGKHILRLDSTVLLHPLQNKPVIHLLIISKNPNVYISDLIKTFSIQQIVLDGSVPQWKAKRWRKDCDSLHIPCHDVAEKGAFVMTL